MRARLITSKVVTAAVLILVILAVFLSGVWGFIKEAKSDGRRIDLVSDLRYISFEISYHMKQMNENREFHLQEIELHAEFVREMFSAIKDGSEKFGISRIKSKDEQTEIETLASKWAGEIRPVIQAALKALAGGREKDFLSSVNNYDRLIHDYFYEIDRLVSILNKDYDRKIEVFGIKAIGFFLGALATAVVLYVYIQKKVIGPVLRLSDNTRAFAAGDLSARVTGYNQHDEIGELASSFNRMAETIEVTVAGLKSAERALLKYNETLESTVKQRTGELEQANNQLQSMNYDLMSHKEETETARLLAESANRAKSEFLTNMSHELRTPLNSIIGFSDLLISGMAGRITEEQKNFVRNIFDSGQHLLSLINDILDLSKIEAGRLELEPHEFLLHEMLKRSLDMFNEKAMKRNLKLGMRVEGDIGQITADERKIKQVVFNLLSNAIKFTPDGGSVSISARRVRSQESGVRSNAPHPPAEIITPPSPPLILRGGVEGLTGGKGDFIEISVEDTGIGIKEGDMQRLFRPFEQLDSSLSKKAQGTGLGLNLCKKIIELHSGRIWAESNPGKGSRFVFVIPQCDANLGWPGAQNSPFTLPVSTSTSTLL